MNLLIDILARCEVTAAGCWRWRGAMSRSGRRKTRYAHVRVSVPRRRMVRVNRLLLLLKTAPIDVPRDLGEAFFDWLDRAQANYRHVEAAHTCDNSECVNPGHLVWETHSENMTRQAERNREKLAGKPAA